MTVSVFLLSNSMPLIVHLCFVASALLLLFLCSTASCLASQYQSCHQDSFRFGDFNLSYPFGQNGSGCGDPEFQFVGCDKHSSHPMLNISGEEYRILALLLFNNSKIIVNYPQLWSSDSAFRISASTYTNLTLLGQCDKSNEGMSQLAHLPLCGDDWYYNIRSPEDGVDFCQTHLQVPINKISAQFLCYCPDGSTYPDMCPTNPHGTFPEIPPYPHAPAYDPHEGQTDNPKPSASTAGRKNRSAIVIGCSVGGAALTALALVLFLMYCAKGRKLSPKQGTCEDKYERKDIEDFVPGLNIGNLSIFSYEELRQATNRFHEENEIGGGGFGSVYLGKLRDGRIVAVKRLYQDGSRTVAQFINEVAIFSSINHPHLVRLYGCTSANSQELLLVYEFVPNGTLENHLHGDRKVTGGLSWNTRLNIAFQTAQALAFLHSLNPPIFHRDVKSSNILLNENFNVKVADFGLCRHVPVNASHVTATPQATPGYLDPEYHKYYQLTEKSDVYSFGVVLVEIISAKLAVDVNRDTREINLANMAISKIQEGALHELVDPQLEFETNEEVKVAVSAVAELAFRCLASESDDRPHMKGVVGQLEVIRGLWDVCPSPHEEQSVSFPNHKNWRSLPTSVQEKWPIMGYHAYASA